MLNNQSDAQRQNDLQFKNKAVFTVPVKTISEANNHDHWGKKYARHQNQKKTMRTYLLSLRPKIDLPAKITLVRIAPRSLDYDNLVSSMKYIVDEICDYIIPGLKPGRADSDNRLSFAYSQMKGDTKTYAVKVEIEF